MKTIGFAVFAVLSLLLSCHPPNKRNPDAGAVEVSAQGDSVFPYAGYWLCEKYYNKLMATKSPRDCQNDGDFIELPEKSGVQTTRIISFHQGTGWKVLKTDGQYALWESWDTVLSGTKEEIEIISPTQIKIGGEPFVKIDISTHEDNYLILEQLLFAGRYRSTTGETVAFKKTGEVDGLGKYHHFMAELDYMDEGLNVDQLGLAENDTSELTWYGFKFRGDTLQIHELKCVEYDSTNKTCGVVDFGEVAYKLIREN